MKLKNLFLVGLMVCLTSLIPEMARATDFSLVVFHDSRYIFDGIDFAAKDDAAVDFFGISITEKKLNSFFYVAASEDYFEWGIDLNYTLSFKGIDWKTTFFPFGWTGHGETYWGFMIIDEVTIKNSITPIIAKHSYAYIPDLKELNGHYFYLGTNKDILSFNLQAGVNYNKHLFTGGSEGWGGILGISKSIELNEKVFLDLYFKYYINAGIVNEDEQVIGVSLAIKL